jgi:hypothetical protein
MKGNNGLVVGFKAFVSLEDPFFPDFQRKQDDKGVGIREE